MRASRHHLLPAVSAVVAVLFAMSGPALAAAAPGWSQYQGGASHAGAVDTGPAPGYRVAWAALEETGGPGGAYGLSAPVIGDGVAVAVGPTGVVGIDLATGDVAWRIDRVLGPSVAPALAEGPDGPIVVFTEGWGDGPPDASETPAPSGSPSPSPTPDEDPEDGSASRLVAVPVGGGDPLWTVDLPDVSRTGVTIAGDVAVVGSIDGTVTAVRVTDGSEAWAVPAGGVLDAPLAASDEVVLVPVRGDEDSAAALVALTVADGNESWRYEPQTGASSIGPASLGDDTAFVSLPDASVRAVSLDDGAERWRATLNAYVNPFTPASPPVVVDGTVVVADVRGQVYRLDGGTGARIWDHAYNRPVLRSSPVVVGDHVVLATADGRVAAFDLGTGDLVWEGSVAGSGGEGSTSPLRAMAVSDGAIVAVRGGADAGMVALANDPEAPLIRQVSPTTLDAPSLLLGWAVALIVAAAAFAIGRFLWARLGPVELPDGEGSEEDA